MKSPFAKIVQPVHNTVLNIVSLAALVLLCTSCKKEHDHAVCMRERNLVENFSNCAGIVIYSEKHHLYAIQFADTLNGNIDNMITAYTCHVPQDFRSNGTKVLVSGTLKAFDAAENIKPQTGGEKVFFLEYTMLVKQ